jgi:limonene 1,2-monooxygenase
LAAEGGVILGTPDDAIAKIRELQEASGGFGGYLNMAVDWSTREKTRRSYELFARYVAPVFTDNLGSIPYSWKWTVERREKLAVRGGVGVRLATQEYMDKKTAREQGPGGKAEITDSKSN